MSKPSHDKGREFRYSVDSLKVRIPLSRANITDESIRQMVHRVVDETGEVLESKENTQASRDAKGIKTTFSIEQRATEFDTIRYLVILVNAKQLGKHYFEGIRTFNVRELYDYLMSLGVVQFSLREFLKSECTDIDFKKDFYATDDEMKEAFDLMQANSQPSADYDKGNKLFWRRDNKGLQFNKRTTTKIKTAPFFKIYSKTLDLLGKSNIFALAHFGDIPRNMWRMEFTIKNKKHLASFGHGNTLSDILNLSEDQIEHMGETSLKAVLNKRVRESSINSDTIPPRDLILVNALILLIDSGIGWTIIKKNLLGSLTSGNRAKKNHHLNTLFDSYIRPIEHYSSAVNVDSILNQIGYNF
jgi:hypothetical protein